MLVLLRKYALATYPAAIGIFSSVESAVNSIKKYIEKYYRLKDDWCEEYWVVDIPMDEIIYLDTKDYLWHGYVTYTQHGLDPKDGENITPRN